MSAIPIQPVTVPLASRSPALSRLVILDGIRGYLLIAMFLAHFCIEMADLDLYSWLTYLRHSRRLPIGDVEFFLPLSGFVVALSYHGIHARAGMAGLWQTVARRWRWIYGYQVAVAVTLVLMVAAGLPGIDLRHAGDAPTALLVAKCFTLVIAPEYVDILILNLALLPFVPAAFGALARNADGRLALVVLLAWAGAAAGLDHRLSDAIIAAGFDWPRWFGLMGHFNPLSYAPLFFGGFWLGHRFRSYPALFATGALRPLRWVALAAAAVLAFYLIRNSSPGWRAFVGIHNTLLSIHSLLITALVYYIIYWLVAAPHRSAPAAAAGDALRAFFSWRPLTFLGSNSLFVYAVHVLAVVFAKLAVTAIITAGRVPGQLTMLAVAAAGLGFIYAATLLKMRHLPWAA